MSNAVTGERVQADEYLTTSTGRNIYLMHIASYEFAKKWCVGKNVLDFGCGTGYGTHYIAEDTRSIVGVDIDTDSINFARGEYKHQNLEFVSIKANQQLPFDSETFDVVLSFQVIEHIDDDVAYMKEASRLLSENGIIIVITPDRKNRLLPMQQPWNRWHVREYSMDSLSTLIGKVFHMEKSLTMTAIPELAEQELARYSLNKYLLLPFTLPGIPYWIRKKLLTFVRNISSIKLPSKIETTEIPQHAELDVNAIKFEDGDAMSLNLVCIASNKPVTPNTHPGI